MSAFVFLRAQLHVNSDQPTKKFLWVKLHDGYKSTMSIPRWAFVIEKICDGQIADGEYPENRICSGYLVITALSNFRADVSFPRHNNERFGDI